MCTCDHLIFLALDLGTVKLNKANLFVQGIENPHDLAISPHGDAVYVAEIGDKSKKFKLHKYEVVNPAEENF